MPDPATFRTDRIKRRITTDPAIERSDHAFARRSPATTFEHMNPTNHLAITGWPGQASASTEGDVSDTFELLDLALPAHLPPGDWPRSHPDWADHRLGTPLSGNALCRLLAELMEQVTQGRSLDPGLLKHAVACAEAAPTMPLVVDGRRWRVILLAKEALRGRLWTAAIDGGGQTLHPMSDRLQRAMDRLQDAQPPRPGRQTLVHLLEPATENPANNQDDALASALRRSADQIRRPGTWSGLGGELAVRVIADLPGWPRGRALSIVDREGRLLEQHGDQARDATPVRVRFHASHYDAIVDGAIAPVPGDGNCFYRSVLAGMNADERKALLRTPTEDDGEQQLALRALVADRLEALARRPSTLPEPIRYTWIAHTV